jgi:type 1 fimbria pilin
VFRKFALSIIGATLLTLSASSAAGSSNVHLTGIDPATARAGGNITLKGENLTQDNVAAVFVSNASDDFPAPIVEQTGTKIVVKVPKVKAGDYNISIQVKRDVLIQPIRLTIRD